jgi:cytochrome c553
MDRRMRWALLFLALLSTAALAAGDPEAGHRKSSMCAGCHGIPGYRNAYPEYRVPKLGGQHAQYLASALQSYKSGDRSHPTMRAIAAGLSDQDIADLAAYFSARPQQPQGTKR